MVKLSEGMKAEIEECLSLGLWESRKDFIEDAVNEHIKKHFTGNRYYQGKYR